MIVKLYNHKWSGKYGFCLEAETPLSINPIDTLLYENITKEKFEYYLKRFKDLNNDMTHYNIEFIPGDNSDEYIITEKYIKR